MFIVLLLSLADYSVAYDFGDEQFPGVKLADLHRFGNVGLSGKGEAYANAKLANNLMTFVEDEFRKAKLQTNQAWFWDQRLKIEYWRLLGKANDPEVRVIERLHSLYLLKDYIGERNYQRGRLPCPVFSNCWGE